MNATTNGTERPRLGEPAVGGLDAPLSGHEKLVLLAVRELAFGAVEVVVHDRRITEIRQTRRTRTTDARET